MTPEGAGPTVPSRRIDRTGNDSTPRGNDFPFFDGLFPWWRDGRSCRFVANRSSSEWPALLRLAKQAGAQARCRRGDRVSDQPAAHRGDDRYDLADREPHPERLRTARSVAGGRQRIVLRDAHKLHLLAEGNTPIWSETRVLDPSAPLGRGALSAARADPAPR